MYTYATVLYLLSILPFFDKFSNIDTSSEVLIVVGAYTVARKTGFPSMGSWKFFLSPAEQGFGYITSQNRFEQYKGSGSTS